MAAVGLIRLVLANLITAPREHLAAEQTTGSKHILQISPPLDPSLLPSFSLSPPPVVGTVVLLDANTAYKFPLLLWPAYSYYDLSITDG